MGAVCVAAALAGCGSDSGSAGPLDNALGYLPKDAPFVVAIDTDLEGDQFQSVKKIVDKFPFGDQIAKSLQQSLANQSLDYEKDLKPLLGNEFVVGVDDPQALTGGGGSSFVGAIEADDGGKLDDVIAGEKPKQVGEKDGAKIYQDDDGDAFAVDDDVLVVAGSRQQLEKALDQRDGDDRLTEETFDDGTEGLPKNALVRVYGDLQSLLESSSSTAAARKIKWVAALRTLGITASVKDDEIDIDYRVATDSSDLTDADLPIASGAASPAVVSRPGEIGFGIRVYSRPSSSRRAPRRRSTPLGSATTRLPNARSSAASTSTSRRTSSASSRTMSHSRSPSTASSASGQTSRTRRHSRRRSRSSGTE